MSFRIPGVSPPPAAAVRRQDESRARLDKAAADSAGRERAPVAEPDVDQWIPRPFAAGPEPPAPVEAPPVAEAREGPEPQPTTAEAAGTAAETVRRAMQAGPPQAYGVHGNLVPATVLNLLA